MATNDNSKVNAAASIAASKSDIKSLLMLVDHAASDIEPNGTWAEAGSAAKIASSLLEIVDFLGGGDGKGRSRLEDDYNREAGGASIAARGVKNMAIAAIATTTLNLLDFSAQSVWNIEKALGLAYDAGHRNAKIAS